jgi:hypothetical protein
MRAGQSSNRPVAPAASHLPSHQRVATPASQRIHYPYPLYLFFSSYLSAAHPSRYLPIKTFPRLISSGSFLLNPVLPDHSRLRPIADAFRYILLPLYQPLSIRENPFDQCLPVPACRGSAVRFWAASSQSSSSNPTRFPAHSSSFVPAALNQRKSVSSVFTCPGLPWISGKVLGCLITVLFVQSHTPSGTFFFLCTSRSQSA